MNNVDRLFIYFKIIFVTKINAINKVNIFQVTIIYFFFKIDPTNLIVLKTNFPCKIDSENIF